MAAALIQEHASIFTMHMVRCKMQIVNWSLALQLMSSLRLAAGMTANNALVALH
jgi:hypothetical protein